MGTSQLCSWSSFHLRSGSHTNVCSLSTRKRGELCQNCTRSYPSYRLICIYSNCSFAEFFEWKSYFGLMAYVLLFNHDYLFAISKMLQLPHNAKSFWWKIFIWGFDSPNMVETDLSETEETQGGFHAAADKMIFLGNYIEPTSSWWLSSV